MRNSSSSRERASRNVIPTRAGKSSLSRPGELPAPCRRAWSASPRKLWMRYRSLSVNSSLRAKTSRTRPSGSLAAFKDSLPLLFRSRQGVPIVWEHSVAVLGCAHENRALGCGGRITDYDYLLLVIPVSLLTSSCVRPTDYELPVERAFESTPRDKWRAASLYGVDCVANVFCECLSIIQSRHPWNCAVL